MCVQRLLIEASQLVFFTDDFLVGVQAIKDHVDPESQVRVSRLPFDFSGVVWDAEIALEYQSILTVGKWLQFLTIDSLCQVLQLQQLHLVYYHLCCNSVSHKSRPS